MNTYHRLPILDGLELLDAKNHVVSFPMHTHETYNIALILNGTLKTIIENKSVAAPKGTLFVTNPQDIRANICDAKIGNSFLTFYISPEVVISLNNGANAFFENRVILNPELFEKFYFLSQRFNDPKTDFEPLFVNALKKLIVGYSNTKTVEYRGGTNFKTYIEGLEFEDFSLEKTAHQFGLNKYKFLRLFKQETGLTPNQYVILKRLEKSKRLLQKGNTIADAAIASGFYDNAHYYRHFKKFLGITPLAYQKA